MHCLNTMKKLNDQACDRAHRKALGPEWRLTLRDDAGEAHVTFHGSANEMLTYVRTEFPERQFKIVDFDVNE